jgi:hypothetical protein
MKSPSKLALCFIVALSVASLPGLAADNELTQAEKSAGWILLFDGHSLEGWRSFNKKSPPAKGWEVAGDCLHHLPKGGGGDIISEREFNDFELEWDWKVAPGANSGLKYFISESRKNKDGQLLKGPIGHEYQLIDDNLHEDALRGPKWQTASFYDVLAPTNRVLNPVGSFNHSRVLIRGNHVEHWLNSGLVLSYELGSPEVLEAVAKSKFNKVQSFGEKITGHILLQDHGDEIWFKNVKIHPLSASAQ